MSNATPLIGFIEEYVPYHQRSDQRYHDINNHALATLPLDDDFPPLCRSMFSITGDDAAHGSFRGQRLIYFGGHFNHVLDDLPRWLDKFESFLKKLYWIQAEVHINGGWMCASYVLKYQITALTLFQYVEDLKNSARVWTLEVFDNQRHPSTDTRLDDFLGASRVSKVKRD